MTQTIIQDVVALSRQEVQKRQKKQLKQEAKMRLKVEQAKWEVQKMEMKMNKTRLEHELATTRLHAFEEELTRLQKQANDNDTLA